MNIKDYLFLKDSDFFPKGMILSKNVKVLKNVLVHGLLPCGETVLNHVEVEPIPVRYYIKKFK